MQLVDGFSNTQDNISGRLIDLFWQSGFTEVKQSQTSNTIFGASSIYSALKPATN
ncbi:MAG: hypothetical protein KDF59_02785 [Nitrosomonas sp.]|nr:hypothetical protein [Nitrosomonas sp.]